MLSNKNNIALIVGGIIVVILGAFLLMQKDGVRQNDVDQAEANVGGLTEEQLAQTEIENINYAVETNEALSGATMEVVGASLITPDDVVVTFEGKPTDTSVAPASELAPKRTGSLDKNDLPSSVILLNASAAGFSPDRITVNAGEPTTIALSSTDEFVHVLKFVDANLNAVQIGVMPGETKAITFNAPAAGTYNFFCEVPEHKDRGEVGVMVVR